MRTLIFAALTFSLLSLPVRAQEEVPPADVAKAQKVVSDWLDAVKAKKWDRARKLTHPKTLEVIADIKKRTEVENHALAPWARVKESYLQKFELGEARPSDKGSAIVRATEEHFSIVDQGVEEGVVAEYLVVPIGGVWYVTDRRLGENVFSDGTVAASFKGYFEGEFTPAKPAAPAKKGKSKKG